MPAVLPNVAVVAASLLIYAAMAAPADPRSVLLLVFLAAPPAAVAAVWGRSRGFAKPGTQTQQLAILTLGLMAMWILPAWARTRLEVTGTTAAPETSGMGAIVIAPAFWAAAISYALAARTARPPTPPDPTQGAQ